MAERSFGSKPLLGQTNTNPYAPDDSDNSGNTRRRNQALGKRKDPRYTQISPYVNKDVYHQFKRLVMLQGDEVSEVIEELIEQDVARRLEQLRDASKEELLSSK